MITGIILRLDSLDEYAALDDQQFGKLIRAGLQFAIDGNEPDLSAPEKYLWPGMRLKIQHDIEQYNRKCEKNSANANRRWHPNTKTDSDANAYDRIQSDAKDANNNSNNNSNNNININDNNNINNRASASSGGKQKQKRTFVPPSIDEVRQYCRERNNTIDPEQFVDYYQRSGWIMGNGQKVKDWKACVRTWEKNQKGTNYGLSRTRPADRIPGQRDLYER